VVPNVNHLLTTIFGVLAPGGSGTGDQRDVISTWVNPAAPNQTNLYARRGGASVAAAHVTGVVALLLAEGLSPAQAVQRVVATTHRVSCGADCNGLIDAAAAVGAVGPPATAERDTVPAPAPTVADPPASPPTPPSTASPPAGAQPDLVVPEPDVAMAAPVPIAGTPVASGNNTPGLSAQAVLGWLGVALLCALVLRFGRRRHYGSDGLP
jgi:subtilisin family serine protease